MTSHRYLRLAAAGAVTLIAALAVVACGSKSGASDTSNSGSAASSAPATASVSVAGTSVSADPSLSSALPEKIRKAGVIKAVSTCPYAPYIYTEGSNSNECTTGVQRDIMVAIGAKLGVNVKYSYITYDGLIPGMIAGTYDVLASAIHDTKEREAQLSFVDDLNVGSSMIIKKGNPDGVTDMTSLCGKSVVLESSSAQVGLVDAAQPNCRKAGKPAIKKVLVPDDAASLLAVKTGRGVAFFSDKLALSYIAQTTDSGKTFDLAPAGGSAGYGVSPVGIGILKTNTQLVSAVQKGLQSLIDDGTYAKILEKYNLGFAKVDSATVNGATE